MTSKFDIGAVRTALACAVLMAVPPAAAEPAIAQQAVPLPTGRPMQLDIAGIKLGATPTDAKSALVRAGYRIQVNTTRSFAQSVSAAAERRRGRTPRDDANQGVGGITADGPHQEFATVVFMQRPEGSVVGSVTVAIPGDAVSEANFRRQLAAKYGKPDAVRASGAELTWCSAEIGAACGILYNAGRPTDTAFPRLQATWYGKGNLSLDVGQKAWDQLIRDAAAALERAAPKSDKAAF